MLNHVANLRINNLLPVVVSELAIVGNNFLKLMLADGTPLEIDNLKEKNLAFLRSNLDMGENRFASFRVFPKTLLLDFNEENPRVVFAKNPTVIPNLIIKCMDALKFSYELQIDINGDFLIIADYFEIIYLYSNYLEPSVLISRDLISIKKYNITTSFLVSLYNFSALMTPAEDFDSNFKMHEIDSPPLDKTSFSV